MRFAVLLSTLILSACSGRERPDGSDDAIAGEGEDEELAPNGASCGLDGDLECASGRCIRYVCLGDECTSDDECEEGACKADCYESGCTAPAAEGDVCTSYTDDGGCSVENHRCSDGLVCSLLGDNGEFAFAHCVPAGGEGAPCTTDAPTCDDESACVAACALGDDPHHCVRRAAQFETCEDSGSGEAICLSPCAEGLECSATVLVDGGIRRLLCGTPAEVDGACDPRIPLETLSPDDGCVDGAHCDAPSSTCQPD